MYWWKYLRNQVSKEGIEERCEARSGKKNGPFPGYLRQDNYKREVEGMIRPIRE